MFEGLKLTNLHAINYNTYGLVRRALLVALVIFLKDYTLLQIFLFNLHQLAFLSYLYTYRPLEDPKQMKMELFNETMLLLASQTLFVFTDYLSAGFDPHAKYIFGWYLAGLMIVTVLTNTAVSLFDTLRSLL